MQLGVELSRRQLTVKKLAVPQPGVLKEVDFWGVILFQALIFSIWQFL